MEAIAKLNNCPTSPRKMRLVADIIRGKEAGEALNILKFSKKEPATKLYKLLLSAINNWEQKSGESADNVELFIKTIFVNEVFYFAISINFLYSTKKPLLIL